MDINIRVAGEAGQGVKTTGSLLVGAFAHMGLHVLASQSYMSRIRGGLNWFDVRVGDRELFGGRESADLLVALTKIAAEVLRGQLAPGGRCVLDSPAGPADIPVAFEQAAREAGGSALMANTVAAGAVFAVLGYAVVGLCAYLREQFAGKGQEIIDKNISCARRGAELVGRQGACIPGPVGSGVPKTVCSGADAVAIGAATAGLRFYTAYPMTPSTAVLTYLAQHAESYGMVVEQAEDEIAAINMACGAAYAGVPAMTGTSGGGFALMVEGVSLAGMLELPVVILVGQRPGPATGMPTRTAQQDLRFILHAGHGEFPRAIFAPGTISQAYELTRRAMETAHRYQTPVFILTDQFLMDLEATVAALDGQARPIDRCIVTGSPDYARYALVEGGVSPRAVPGGESFVVVDSDEHGQDGHLSEDLAVRIAQQDKRMAKLGGLTAEAMAPEYYGPDGAETLLVAWGSTFGPAREAADIVADKGGSAAVLHFAQVWPLNVPAARQRIAGARRIVCVEGNQTAQFASLLREAGLIGDCEHILRYDGMPFTGQEIAARLERAGGRRA
jgi:2-oxoglutarate ferredoxin oxidoreductase subunit alpha